MCFLSLLVICLTFFLSQFSSIPVGYVLNFSPSWLLNCPPWPYFSLCFCLSWVFVQAGYWLQLIYWPSQIVDYFFEIISKKSWINIFFMFYRIWSYNYRGNCLTFIARDTNQDVFPASQPPTILNKLVKTFDIVGRILREYSAF